MPSSSISPNFSRTYTNRRTRVLIADDHVLVAQAIKNLLEPEFWVVGFIPDGRQFLASIHKLQPDVIILDISMPLLNGLDAAEQIRAIDPRIKLVYMTKTLGAQLAAEAFRRGASGYILKYDEAASVAVAVRRVARGESYISPGINRDEFEYHRRRGKEYRLEKKLTVRQREVLELLVKGRTTKQIGDLLDLKPGTVTFHKYRIMQLLGVRTTAGLLQYALKQAQRRDDSHHRDFAQHRDEQQFSNQLNPQTPERRREIHESCGD